MQKALQAVKGQVYEKQLWITACQDQPLETVCGRVNHGVVSGPPKYFRKRSLLGFSWGVLPPNQKGSPWSCPNAGFQGSWHR